MIIKFIKDIKIITLILFVTTLAYLPIFRNGFVIDDHVFVGKYHPSITEALRGAVPSGHEGVYRPIRAILYTVYYHLFGTNPFWYHLHSLLVHLAATVLVYWVIREIGGRGMIGLIGGLLFGLHPVHTESITYIAASMEMTGVVFFFGAFWLYLRNSKFSVVLALLAFFTYEMTITLPLLLVLYEATLGAFHPRGERSLHLGGVLRKTWTYWAGAGIYLFIRFVILGIAGRSTYPGGSIWYTLLTLPKVLIHYLWVILWPANLMNNHIIAPGVEAFVYRGYRTAAILSQSILDPEILFSITIITVITIITIIRRKKNPILSFGIAWFFVTLLPVMGLVPQGSMFNERMLYIPSVGFVMILASIFYNFYPAEQGLASRDNRYNHYNRYIWAGIILVFMLYGVRTAVRNADWKDDVTLWRQDVASAPTENAYAYFAMGNAYYNRKEYGEAAAAYEQSVAINPGFAVGYASLSRTYRDMGNVARSNVYYQKADDVEPGFWSRP